MSLFCWVARIAAVGRISRRQVVPGGLPEGQLREEGFGQGEGGLGGGLDAAGGG